MSIYGAEATPCPTVRQAAQHSTMVGFGQRLKSYSFLNYQAMLIDFFRQDMIEFPSATLLVVMSNMPLGLVCCRDDML
jgi:hypothetical protein